MSIEILQSFLGWCTVINFGLLLLWAVGFMLAHAWIYRLHMKWFSMPVERFNAIHYAGMALFKICILFFNLVPYIALQIVA